MKIKILQVFYDKNGLPYKDKERTVHYPITSGTFLGASNTTQIRFYYDQLDELNESTFVAVSKLPNGKIGSEILESEYDSELKESYAILNLSQFYTQYKGDVYISLQGYQGGVRVEQDEDGIYQIYGTPTIQATGSIKLSIAYAPTFIGSGQTENITLQRVLAELSTKLGIRQETLHVEELPTVGNPNVWYVVNDDPNNPNIANIYVWNENTSHYVWVGDNTLDLGEYYTKEEGQSFENDVNNDIDGIRGQVQTIAQGGPKGVYSTVTALESADPDHAYIYLVTADGKWYYFDTGTNLWTAGGTYLSTSGSVMQTYPQADYSDCNNVPVNSIITVVSGNYYSNLPVQKEGTLLTFNQYRFNAGSTGSTQIFITYDNNTYTRIKWGSWTNWEDVGNADTIKLGYGLSSTYQDLNDVPSGLAITYASPLTSYSNLPSNKEGVLFSFGAYKRTGNNGSSQLFVDTSGDVWTRIKWGSWSSWKKTNASDNIYTKVRYEDFIYEKYNFHNKSSLWVGDSITRGETIGGVVVENPGAKLFSEYCEMSYTNIAIGGSRFTGDNATILGQLTNNQLRNTDYIFIGAGVNDCLANASISDFKTAVNAVIDYIVANYDENVKVFFITPIRNYQNETNNDKLYEYRNAITECVIAKNNNRFNVIQGDKFDFPLYESDSTYKTSMSEDGLHPTQLGYSTAYLRGLIKALVL